jgi:putative hydrolase of the HAD superfamily
MDCTKFRECVALLFDFGGTIDSDGDHWLDRFFALYEAEGLAFHRDDIKRAFYEADSACHADAGMTVAGLRSLVHSHVRLQFDALGFHDAAMHRQLAGLFCQRAEHVMSLRAGLFRTLKGRFRTGIVSNFFGNLEVVLGEAGLSGAFDVVIDSGRVGVSKPDYRIFLLALERLALRPEQAVFIGDSYERDMVPSAQIGMRTIWLKGPNPRIPENAPPVDAVITKLAELEALAP